MSASEPWWCTLSSPVPWTRSFTGSPTQLCNLDVVTALLGLSAARTQMVDARAALQAARVALAEAEGVVTELP